MYKEWPFFCKRRCTVIWLPPKNESNCCFITKQRSTFWSLHKILHCTLCFCLCSIDCLNLCKETNNIFCWKIFFSFLYIFKSSFKFQILANHKIMKHVAGVLNRRPHAHFRLTSELCCWLSIIVVHVSIYTRSERLQTRKLRTSRTSAWMIFG